MCSVLDTIPLIKKLRSFDGSTRRQKAAFRHRSVNDYTLVALTYCFRAGRFMFVTFVLVKRTALVVKFYTTTANSYCSRKFLTDSTFVSIDLNCKYLAKMSKRGVKIIFALLYTPRKVQLIPFSV